LTAQTFNCTDMRFRPVFKTHMIWHRPTRSADQSDLPMAALLFLIPYVFRLFCLFLSQSFPSSRYIHW